MVADSSDERFGGPITRRHLMGRALQTGGGLAALSGVGLLAACGDDDQKAAPKRGGTIVFGEGAKPLGFDPAKWWDALPWSATYAVFDRLLTNTQENTVEPELLAKLPKVNADGTEYTFTLRPGVAFHNGGKLRADDVKFTLERLVSPGLAAEGASLYVGLPILGMQDLLNEKTDKLKGVSVVDEKTFTVQLERPDSAFLYLLGLPFMGIVPREVVERVGDKKFNLEPVGTGPFAMRNVDIDRELTLERNKPYWRKGGPSVDRIQWKVGVDPELSILRIQRGEQDMMQETVPAGSLDQLRNDPSLSKQLIIGDENLTWFLTTSLKHEAMRKLKVRQAIAMAIDKERLVRAEKGLGSPATGGMFSPLSPFYQDGLSPPFDPARAKELMAEAGHADGFEISLITKNYTPWKEPGQTIQQDLAEIGIRVSPRYLERDAYSAAVSEYPAALTFNGWELPYPHGSYVMDSAYTTDAKKTTCCNFSYWSDPEFDKLVAQAHSETEEGAVADLYKTMDRMTVKDEVLFIPLYYPKHAEFVSARLRGYAVPKTPIAEVKFFANYSLAET